MEQTEIKAIFDAVNNTINKKALLKILKVKDKEISVYIENIIKNAIFNKNQVDIKMSISLGIMFGFSKSTLNYYHELLKQEWHISHEDILSIIEEKKDPQSIPYIEYAIKIKDKLEYLDYDDYGSYYKKCFWALFMINTKEADEIVEKYTKDKNKVLCEAAKERYIEILKRKS